MRLSRVVAVLAAAGLAPHVAHAQSTEWRVSAGRDSFSFRDVARSPEREPSGERRPLRYSLALHSDFNLKSEF
jgi:hypothetical protein